MSAVLRWKIDLRPMAIARAREARARALADGAEYLLEEANRTVPIEEGILTGSGSTDVDASAGIASVYYDTPYAARQHEETGWRHDQGRRAKWLELTCSEQGGRVAEYMADTMRGALS